jgi:hypothetical protein
MHARIANISGNRFGQRFAHRMLNAITPRVT